MATSTSSAGNPACATSGRVQLVQMRGSLKFGSFGSRIRISSLAGILALSICLGTAIAQKKPPSQPININTATIEQLESLPGIGPNTAKSIVDFRNRTGPFQRVEDLLAIKGISKSKLEKLRPYVTVGPSAPNRHSADPHQAVVTLIFSSPNFQEAV
jgi:competence ComEA-like helix-hairpin-helix protein